MAQTVSPAKLKIIHFVKNSKVNEPYTFELEGTQRNAERFVHRMRVELSRLREEVKRRNLIPRPFKMLLQKIEFVPNAAINTQKITLLKVTDANDVSSDIDDIFDEIAGGKNLGE